MKRRREAEPEGDDEHDKQPGAEDSPDRDSVYGIDDFPEELRPEENLGAFKRGNVIKVRMKNFLTFEDTTLHPGPKLNLIVGPNGSGKSSIVGALLVGLNGNLKLLGRSHRLDQFIRYEKNQSLLEVQLHDKNARGGVRTVKRILERTPNNPQTVTSQLFIDGRKATAADVDQLRADYNIQLENLCAFLPQDRVSQFVELTPQELLQNTLLNIGGQDLRDELEKLKQEYRRLEEDQRKSRSNAERLEALVVKNRSLESDVQLFNQRKQMLEKVRVMGLYRPWLEYSEARETAVQKKRERDEAKSELSILEADLERVLAPVNHIEDAVKDSEGKFKGLERRAQASQAQIRQAEKAIEKLESKYHDATTEVKLLKKRANQRQEKIEGLRVAIADLEKERARLDANPNTDELQDLLDQRRVLTGEIRGVGQRKHELQQKIMSKDRERADLMAQVQRLENAKQNLLGKLNRLKRDGSNTPGKCYQWLQENRGRFRGHVFGPIGMELEVDNEYHAKVLESCIPPWALCSLVVETGEDRDILLGELKDRQNLRVDVLSVPTRSDLTFEHPRPISALQPFGLRAYVDETFTAPSSVKRALLAQFPLHTMLIGEASAGEQVDSIARSGVRIFFTPDSTYGIKTSRYGSKSTSTMVDPLKPSKVFVESREDRGLHVELKEKLDAVAEERDRAVQELRRLNESNSRLAREAAAVGEKIEALKRVKNEARRLEEKMEANKRMLAQCEEEQDPSRHGNALELAISKTEEARNNFEMSVDDYLLSLAKHSKMLEGLNECGVLYHKHRVELQRKTVGLQALRDRVNSASKEVEELNTQYRESVRQMTELKRRAETESPATSEFQETFRTLPGNLEELDDMISTEKTRAEALTGASEHVVKEYEEREKQIEDLKQRIRAQEEEHGAHATTLDARRDGLVGKVQTYVNDMSVTFSALYKEINCVGEIQLKNTELLNEMYIEILVSYRQDAPLVPLRPTHHSGGEQMVATMIYIFSLQRLTPNAAFRVIDEMNQGVDARNERALMEMMISDATKGSSQQTFIITPKLLPDLEMGPSLVPHVILNGDLFGQDRLWNPEVFA